MIQTAAKNYQRVVVITDVNDYKQILSEIKNQGQISLATHEQLAFKAIELLSQYNLAIANYF